MKGYNLEGSLEEIIFKKSMYPSKLEAQLVTSTLLEKCSGGILECKIKTLILAFHRPWFYTYGTIYYLDPGPRRRQV